MEKKLINDLSRLNSLYCNYAKISQYIFLKYPFPYLSNLQYIDSDTGVLIFMDSRFSCWYNITKEHDEYVIHAANIPKEIRNEWNKPYLKFTDLKEAGWRIPKYSELNEILKLGNQSNMFYDHQLDNEVYNIDISKYTSLTEKDKEFWGSASNQKLHIYAMRKYFCIGDEDNELWIFSIQRGLYCDPKTIKYERRKATPEDKGNILLIGWKH